MAVHCFFGPKGFREQLAHLLAKMKTGLNQGGVSETSFFLQLSHICLEIAELGVFRQDWYEG